MQDQLTHKIGASASRVVLPSTTGTTSNSTTSCQSAIQRWNRANRGPLEEISCAENNYGIFDYDVRPIPRADKPDF